MKKLFRSSQDVKKNPRDPQTPVKTQPSASPPPVKQPWEDQISLNSFDDSALASCPPVIEHIELNDNRVDLFPYLTPEEIQEHIEKDVFPIPETKDREGYYGPNHYNYWASGLRDCLIVKEIVNKEGVGLDSFLDIGCATGRVIRHLIVNEPNTELYGCDINFRHIRWILEFLGNRARVFQNTSVPTLPIPDASISVVTAYSVFTHIEAFELTWLMEIRRIMKRGAIAYVTVNTDYTLKTMQEHWPLYGHISRHKDFDKSILTESMTRNRYVFRWHMNKSYSSQVILNTDYIRNVWSRYFDIVDIIRQHPGFQDVVLLRKT